MNLRPILLVEDNPDDEVLALQAFKRNNIINKIIVARDGQQAADYLFNSDKELPAFILLDLKLPKMSGLELLAQRREDARAKLAPVIILTSSNEERDKRVAYGLGANSYVSKSLNLDRFIFEIGKMADYWLEINALPPISCE